MIGRSVIDKTGLKDLFDINVQALFDVPEPAAATEAAAPGPPSWIEALMFKAIQDQLGLKLDSAKGTTQVPAIEGVQKPSEN